MKIIKKIIMVVVLGLSILSLTSCSKQKEESEGEAELANPWKTVESMEEAAKGAGIEGLNLASGLEISLGEVVPSEYRCMDGIVEVLVRYPAVDMTIRKGKNEAAEEGDISGDYNDYSVYWTQNVNDLVLNCLGNREGASTKTTWQDDKYSYSITAYGLGGDTDYGLSADDIDVIVKGME